MLRIIALTTRYNAKSNVRFKTSEINDMKIIYNFLTIVDKIKGFPNWIVLFLIDIILEKNRSIASIKLEV